MLHPPVGSACAAFSLTGGAGVDVVLGHLMTVIALGLAPAGAGHALAAWRADHSTGRPMLGPVRLLRQRCYVKRVGAMAVWASLGVV